MVYLVHLVLQDLRPAIWQGRYRPPDDGVEAIMDVALSDEVDKKAEARVEVDLADDSKFIYEKTATYQSKWRPAWWSDREAPQSCGRGASDISWCL